jgi:hypothetical protein
MTTVHKTPGTVLVKIEPSLAIKTDGEYLFTCPCGAPLTCTGNVVLRDGVLTVWECLTQQHIWQWLSNSRTIPTGWQHADAPCQP